MSVKNIQHIILLITTIILVPIISIKAQSSDIPLVTDRPDITESAIVIPDSTLQIENGFLFESQNYSGVTIHNISLLSLLLRFKVFSNVEFRIGGDYQIKETINNYYKIKQSGINNVLVGAKGQFLKESNDGIDLGIIIQFNFSVENKLFSPTSIESEIIIAAGKSLNEIFSLSGNMGLSQNSELNEYFYNYSTSLGIDLGDGWGTFVEIYGDVSNVKQASFNYDAGLTYQLLRNLQLDVSIGTNSLVKYDNWFTGIGISIRFPK